MKKSNIRPARVNEVQVINARGPWETKSGGKLTVVSAFSQIDLSKFFAYNNVDELNRIPEDIRGLRIYTVRDLPKGQIGGTEFHRIREEAIFGLEGSVKWECEDVFGNKKVLTISTDVGIWMSPFILHTYEVMDEGSGLLVIANTLFNPEDPRTHDTYSAEEFHELQGQYI